MKKTPFNISAQTEGQTALVRITGTIGWDTDSESFRTRMDEVKRQGIRDVRLYLHGPGGSCFDAEEIVNIIRETFTGSVTGEGGALVASAYTRIAMICDAFSMPENGMFMIHKPEGGVQGTANDLRSYLKLLEHIESQYLSTYKARIRDAAELARRWEAGAWWMTAGEAKEAGFITGVGKKAKIDAEAAALITACGCPSSKIPIINTNKKNDMDLESMAVSLGLPKSATEAEINAAVAKGQKAQTDLAALHEENAKKEKAAKTAKVKAALDKAEQEKRITADVRKEWEDILHANYESGIKALENLPVVKKVDVNPGNRAADGRATHNGKTFEELQASDPDALAELEKNDPEAFEALFNASLKGK